jgi:hypothetical protein
VVASITALCSEAPGVVAAICEDLSIVSTQILRRVARSGSILLSDDCDGLDLRGKKHVRCLSDVLCCLRSGVLCLIRGVFVWLTRRLYIQPLPFKLVPGHNGYCNLSSHTLFPSYH